MGNLEDLMGRAASVADWVKEHPAAVTAAISILRSRQGSNGPAGGLGGLVSAFRNKGLGDVISSWISTGPNPPVTSGQVTDALGHDTITQFGRQAGIPAGQAGAVLASLLPTLVDHVTPQGQVPQVAALESTLGSLLGAFGR
jgi:uncharacterized protein YidB (DUF937 family)